MKNYLIFTLSFFIIINFSYSQVKEQLVHDDYERTWITYVPKTYSKSNSYPLVIALHGGGGSAKQLMKYTKMRFHDLANKEDFIVVYPQGIKKSWNDNTTRDQNGFARKNNIDDVGFIHKMILQLESTYNINSSAIFVCGISNGGLMSQTLALELPQKVRVIGMVASNFGKDELDKIKTISPFSVLIIHGTEDPIFPYTEGVIEAFGTKRGEVLGVEKSIAFMNSLNGNDTIPVEKTIINKSKNDNCISWHYKYLNLIQGDLKVELIQIKGGGHTWPGAKRKRILNRIVGETTKDFNACDELWSFFKSTMN